MAVEGIWPVKDVSRTRDPAENYAHLPNLITGRLHDHRRRPHAHGGLGVVPMACSICLWPGEGLPEGGALVNKGALLCSWYYFCCTSVSLSCSLIS